MGRSTVFDRDLEAAGKTILKLCLHISWEEQRQRLLLRLGRPDKVWKFSEHDLAVRAKWDDYMAACDVVLRRCSSPVPWFVVPADHKWFRDWAVTNLLLETLREMDPHYPPPTVDVKAMKARLKAQKRV